MSNNDQQGASECVGAAAVSNMPISDPNIERWKTDSPSAENTEGGATIGPDLDSLDLDQLNDNLQDYLEDNLSLEEQYGEEGGKSDDRVGSPGIASCRSASSDPKSSFPVNEDTKREPDGCEPMSENGDTTPTASEINHSMSSSSNQSDTSVEATNGVAQKRNSLEIRNNIPDVNESKSYDSDVVDDRSKLQASGAVPKMRKKSPGLARRLAESMQIEGQDRDTSSSERESEPAQIDTTVHSAQKDFESKLQSGSLNSSFRNKTNASAVKESATGSPAPKEKSNSFEKLCDSLLGNEPNGSMAKVSDSDNSPTEPDKVGDDKSMEVENEYDYIKYARIQHGDSYVGMRLAYSSSNDSLNVKRSWSGGVRPSDEEYLGSSREGSPEKMSQARQARLNDQLRMSKVCEDTLTEIPLNGSDHTADEKNFSLSPEATECDSAEVESVLSDEGKSSTSGMPIVEDGLSSSQGSDIEEMCTQDSQSDTPAQILKRKYKAEIEQELQGSEPGEDGGTPDHNMTENSSSIHSTPSHSGSVGSSIKKDDIDLAIRDIKSAIERSKQAAQQRDHLNADVNSGNQEPIWVMRDSYVKKIGTNDDLKHVRDEYQRHHKGEPQTQEKEHVFHGEDEESPTNYPYGRHDNKNYTSGKGFQSDDEIDPRNHALHKKTRTVKGSHYRALPPDDPEDAYHHSNQDHRLNYDNHSNYGYSTQKVSEHSVNYTSHSAGGTMGTQKSQVSGSAVGSNIVKDPASSSGKPLHSFSSEIPNSRYRSTTLSQHSASNNKGSPTDGRGSNNEGSPEDSRGPVRTAQGNHHGGDTSLVSSYRTELAGNQSRYTDPARYRDPGRRNPFNNMPKEHYSNSESQLPLAVSSGTKSMSASESSHTSDVSLHNHSAVQRMEHRHRRQRRPSYEYHDDSEDDYYYEEEGPEGAYISRRRGGEYDTDEETDELLDKQYMRSEKVDIPELTQPPVNRSAQTDKRQSRAREGEKESLTLRDPDNETVLIEGVLFRARYLGSTQLISEGQPSKALRMMQAQEAVGRIKAPEGENQPSTEVDLFVSIEKIMVLNTDLQEIMMDHALRTISYIADIGDILVIMARRGPVMSSKNDEDPSRKRQTKICCHVFESDEAQLIAQSIGQAFQVAYMEFLKANGIDDPGMFKEIDYQEVLNQQEIFGEELFLFSNKEMQKEVIVPKLKNEPLGVVIVESGWGSMVPTVVLANMSPAGAAARCGQLNIGDQIMSINGVSLVGLPLSSCQTYIKAAKNQTVVKLNVVSCAPVVEVCIKRPDVKYQLGFSVQNGVICSLLRGGIAERGGVRVGHRIIEINTESVVAVPHEKIVKMLATSVGEIHMKTMPTSIFRLLTGQDVPHYI